MRFRRKPSIITRADPEAEREATEWIVNHILHGERDQEELLRIEEWLRRISMPEIVEVDDAAA